MKISTNQMFNNATNQMVTTQSKIAEMQAQLSTGTKLLKASDEPQSAAIILRLESTLAQHDTFQRNLTLVDERLASEESIVQSVDAILMRVKELALTDSNRSLVGQEVEGLRGALLGLANAQDTEGRYIFAGSLSGQPPFQADAAGEVAYVGNFDRLQVDIAVGRSIDLNKPGTDVFGSVTTVDADGEPVTRGFFSVLDDLIAGLDSGDSEAWEQGLATLDTIQNQARKAMVAIGIDRSTIEAEQDLHEESKIVLTAVLSKERDVDYSELITDLSAQMIALESVQGSFAKIAQMSLFDYLR